ncbi:DUF4369 domain-containing protein [Flavobacteriaceae bacterium TP-CH-4]|uniref:DUF4369 domain-containing protein n=1 Tax=Pelagihabitans pacificus TaxID=2696054 RepID=A0A967B3I5_9FLAO|nr:DUF4369 domain-containing protein [Pelagihabitans pacificus]NHF61361.1 DUF4369 domain-containing protein [Pelagihabitans pacificus]
MKRILFSIATALLFFACGDGITENTMIVSGQVKGLKKGTLYLQHIPDSSLVVVDSLQIEGDGHFSFQTELESPEIFYLYLSKKDNNDINDRISFFGEPGAITINTKWNTFDTGAVVEGSESHKKWEEYRKIMSQFNKRNLEILQSSMNQESPLDTLQLDSLQRISDKNAKRGYAYAINFALNNKDSYVAPYIAVHEVADANPKYLDSISNALTPEVADSKYGRELKELLKQ